MKIYMEEFERLSWVETRLSSSVRPFMPAAANKGPTFLVISL